MADSIERIAGEMAACIDHGNGSLTVNSSRVIDWRDRLRALSPAGPIATLHADGFWTWNGTPPHESNYAGWKLDVYAASPQQEPGAVREVVMNNEGCGTTAILPSGQTLAGAGGVLGEIDSLWSLMQEARVSYSGDHASGTFRICGDRLSKIRDSVAALTAPSAGTTGDDSEDAARFRFWLSAIFNGEHDGMFDQLETSETPEQYVAAIDAARRARGEGND